MTVKGGTGPACAACRFQRRKCSSDCDLAPFFPGDKPKMFESAHRLFGVHNIVKILKYLDQNQREETMKSIIYESEIRQRFPVHGCLGVICQLQQQLQQSMEELYYVETRIALCHQQIQGQIPLIPPETSPSSQLQLGLIPANDHSEYHSSSSGTALAPNHFLLNGSNGSYAENIEKPSFEQHPYFDTINNDNSMGIQSPFVASQAFPIQKEPEVSDQDYDNIPFGEAFESSAESKDTTQTIENNLLGSFLELF